MLPAISPASRSRVYAPRNARASPLYRIVQDHLETFLVQDRDASQPWAAPSAEDSLRGFLECGVHRFGVARFLCRRCGHDVFVAYSCKRRLACPSCDSKRALIESSRALVELLPRVPYRQWVLVIPKRLRYFVHRNPALSGELSRILADVLARFYGDRTGANAQASPAQVHMVQRFGSKVNLHVHVHAVASDGTFELEEGRLRFYPVPEPSAQELAELSRKLKRRILLRMLRLGALPEESAREMLARPHGGFSLDAQVSIAADDRAALERLLRYVLRPALSVQRLSYKPEEDLVRYRPKKGRPGDPAVFEWKPLEFLERFSRLIPPPRLHLVRYYGALAPRSGQRTAVSRAAREGIACEELLAGVPADGLRAAAACAQRVIRKAFARSAKSWAACLRKVFEVNPIQCPSCGVEMVPVAAITDDRQLDRLLACLGLPTDWPKTKPARAPPLPFPRQDTQIDPRLDAWDGRDDPPPDD